ncbi:MAG: hypothetical protein ABIA63_11690, partial [bacterium]
MLIFHCMAFSLDWPTYLGNMERNGRSQAIPLTKKPPDLQWSIKLPGGMMSHEGICPIIYKGVVYVTANQILYAIDEYTGQPLWQYVGVYSYPTADNDVLYIGGMSYVEAIDIKTHEKKWQHKTVGNIG